MLCQSCKDIFSGRRRLGGPTTYPFPSSSDPLSEFADYDVDEKHEVARSPFSDDSDGSNSSEESNEGYTHHTTLQSFEEACSSGCVICRLLRNEMKAEDKIDLKKEPSPSVFSNWLLFENRGHYESYSLSMTIPYPEEVILHLRLIANHKYVGRTSQTVHLAGTSTNSDAAFDQALEWYNTCHSHHVWCNVERSQHSDGNHLPSRLLRIDEHDPSGIRLIITKDWNVPIAGYFTLSHCWGGAEIPQLTSSTMDDMMSRIPTGRLPNTFAEAIEVCRRFSMPYLWIDSLCILQDSQEDWATEASRMEVIYSNSELNIMATDSENSHQGLFRSRDPQNLALPKIQSEWVDAPNDCFHIWEGTAWSAQLEDCPLIKRGWVLQERILPPRALHYGKDRLFWECRELDACEANPEGVPVYLRGSGSLMKVTDPGEYLRLSANWKLQEYKTKSSDIKSCAHELWKKWVESYSGMQLTKESDKFIAINGLAQRTQATLQDDYLAGLWRSYIVQDLAWCSKTNKSTELTLGRIESQAPTWSWASVKNHVFYIEGIQRPTVSYIRVRSVTMPSNLKPRYKDEKKPGNNGEMRATGLLARGEVYRSEEDDKYGYPLYFLTVDTSEAPCDMYPDEPMLRGERREVVLLPVTSSLRNTVTYRVALLLQNATGFRRGFYTRFGAASDHESECMAPDNPAFVELFAQARTSDIFDSLGDSDSSWETLSTCSHSENESVEAEPGPETGEEEPWPKIGEEELYLEDAPGEFIII